MATSLADQCVLCMLDKNQKAQTDMVELSVASDFGFITSGYSTAYCTPICSKEICNCDRNAQKQVSKEKKVMQTLVILKTEVFLILLPSLPVSEDFLTKSPKSKCRNGLCSNLSRLMCVVRSPRCCITAMVPLNHCCINFVAALYWSIYQPMADQCIAPLLEALQRGHLLQVFHLLGQLFSFASSAFHCKPIGIFKHTKCVSKVTCQYFSGAVQQVHCVQPVYDEH